MVKDALGGGQQTTAHKAGWEEGCVSRVGQMDLHVLNYYTFLGHPHDVRLDPDKGGFVS